FWLAWLIDICAQHADNRQAVFQQDEAGGIHARFVDHGHLFGGPKGGTRPHFLASRYLDPRIYQRVSSHHLLEIQKVAQRVDAEWLWERVEALPDEWKTASALKGFAECLNRLSQPGLVQNILDTMS